MKTTVTGVRANHIGTDTDAEPGAYAITVGKMVYEPFPAECPYCRRPLRILLKGRGIAIDFGRYVMVFDESSKGNRPVICDPVPPGYVVVSCEPCKCEFTLPPNWRQLQASQEIA